MAFLTFGPGLKLSRAPQFEARYRPGQFAPVTGIYQCSGCGFETVCVAAKPLQSREDKRLPRHPRDCPGVSWRLVAQVNERPWLLAEQGS
ncbi:hypothetical protein ACA040_002459 [Xenophilus aerolatus]